jgi:MATE family multidrug resistance protein
MTRAAALPRPSHAWRTEARATIALAYPLILTNLAQAAIHATDLIMLGRLGADALAAAALGVGLFNTFLMFGLGVATATAPMLARELGRKSNSVREFRRTVRQGMWTAIAIAIPCWLLLWQAEPILIAMGQEPALASDAAIFVRALQWGLLPFLFFVVLRSFVSALERPIWSLVVGGAAVLVNAAMNYVLIFGGFGLPPLGLLGAGIGSALTNLFTFAAMALIVSLHPRFRRYRLFGRFWHADWPRFRAVMRLGGPIGMMLWLEVAVFSAAVFLMGLIGEDALAAHAIAIQIAALSFMVPLGLGQAVTVRVGLALGRGDGPGIARAGWTAFAMGVCFMALMALLMVAAPRLLIGAFLDIGDPANGPVVTLAVSFLAVAGLFQIVDGAQVVGAGMLRGLHDTKMPMLFALVGYWLIGLTTGVLLAFPAGWGGVGIWLGLAAGLAIVAVLIMLRWRRRTRIGLAPG